MQYAIQQQYNITAKTGQLVLYGTSKNKTTNPTMLCCYCDASFSTACEIKAIISELIYCYIILKFINNL